MKHLRSCVLASLVLAVPMALAQPATPKAPEKPAPAKPETTKPDPAKPEATKPAPTKATPASEPAPTTTAKPEDPKASPAKAAVSPAVLEYVMPDIDGKSTDLSQFKGKVVLIVNVASNCGFTPQYAGLEKLYQERKDKGLVILGFPANDFNGQEPGDAAKIKETCFGKYKVTFPMFSKISVVSGPNQAPLYRQLASQPAPIGGDPKWNFTKFLVDRTGNVVRRFDTRIKPDDAALLRAVDDELAKAPAASTEPKK